MFVITWQWGKPTCFKSEPNVFQACFKFRLYAEIYDKAVCLLFSPPKWVQEWEGAKICLLSSGLLQFHLTLKYSFIDSFEKKTYLALQAHDKKKKVVMSVKPGLNSRFAIY